MENLSLGSITFVISENHTQGEEISDELAGLLTQEFVAYFNYLLHKRDLDKVIAVTGVEHFRGCITIVISLSVLATAAGGWAIVEALKNYKDASEGVSRLVKDLKNAKIWISKKLFRTKTKQVSEADPVLPALQKDKEALGIIFQQVLEQYEAIEPKYQKYWSSGQEVTIVDERGKYCKLTVAVKREDVTPPDESQIVAKVKKAKKQKEKKKQK